MVLGLVLEELAQQRRTLSTGPGLTVCLPGAFPYLLVPSDARQSQSYVTAPCVPCSLKTLGRV